MSWTRDTFTNVPAYVFLYVRVVRENGGKTAHTGKYALIDSTENVRNNIDSADYAEAEPPKIRWRH